MTTTPTTHPPSVRTSALSWRELVENHSERPLRWGRWDIDLPRFCLVLAEGTRDEREVDLDRITSPAAFVAAIYEISEMNGVTPQDQADYLSALRTVLNPQRYYASPSSKALDPRKVAAEAGYEVPSE